MSAQVDVLAVLDDIAENVKGIHTTSQRTGEAFGRDLSQARAAVAELIAAAEGVSQFFSVRYIGHPEASQLLRALAVGVTRVGGKPA